MLVQIPVNILMSTSQHRADNSSAFLELKVKCDRFKVCFQDSDEKGTKPLQARFLTIFKCFEDVRFYRTISSSIAGIWQLQIF